MFFALVVVQLFGNLTDCVSLTVCEMPLPTNTLYIYILCLTSLKKIQSEFVVLINVVIKICPKDFYWVNEKRVISCTIRQNKIMKKLLPFFL